jgi:hypothetical protein
LTNIFSPKAAADIVRLYRLVFPNWKATVGAADTDLEIVEVFFIFPIKKI